MKHPQRARGLRRPDGLVVALGRGDGPVLVVEPEHLTAPERHTLQGLAAAAAVQRSALAPWFARMVRRAFDVQ